MKLETAFYTAKSLLQELQEAGVSKVKALAVMVHDELVEYENRFDNGGLAYAYKTTTKKSRLILGLGFSEFFIEDYVDGDSEYIVAEDKRQMLLGLLDIDSFELYKAIELLYGRVVA